MKKIAGVISITICCMAFSMNCAAQKNSRQKDELPAAPKERALKPEVVKPIVPGGEYKAPLETIALPAGKTLAAPKDRTEVPNPAAKMPVNTMPVAARPAAPVTGQQQPAVQEPAVQHN